MKRGLLALLLVAATPAAAHDWYPSECCSGTDCAPVEKVEILSAPMMAFMFGPGAAPPAPGTMAVTTKHGTVVIPQNFPRRESKDGRMHACMRPEGNGMKLLCIFMPPAT